ncbi:RDD family protein [Streptomyces torulosus]|uniref:RDD family protein n=1 Tax=Streptomyces torulosus TaxID=68276 RepID=UPI00099E7BA9
MQKQVRCPNCGAPVTPADAFCSECGHRQAEPEPGSANSASPRPILATLPPESPPPPPSDPPPAFSAPPSDIGQRLPAPMNCPNCGQITAGEVSCQFCGQALILPPGILLSTVGRRFGGYLLEFVLAICTLGLGWLIWAFIIFRGGQTPAKQVLHMRVISIQQARAAGWWRMFFREFIAKTLIAFVSVFLIPYFWLLWDRNRQELWDKMATTLVVSDPTDQLRPPSREYREQAHRS